MEGAAETRLMEEQRDKLVVMGLKFKGVKYLGSSVDVPLTYNMQPRYDHWLLRTTVKSRPGQQIWVYRDICDPRGVFRAVVRKTIEGDLEFDGAEDAESQVDFAYNQALYSCRMGKVQGGVVEYSMIKEALTGNLVNVIGTELQEIQGRVELLKEVCADRPWCRNPGCKPSNVDKVFAQSVDVIQHQNAIGFYLKDLGFEDAFNRKIEYTSVEIRYNFAKV